MDLGEKLIQEKAISSKPFNVSGLWDNKNMRKGLKALACLLLGVSISALSVSPAQAQNKPDPKVLKDCEAVNATYDSATYYLYLHAPLSKNRDLARYEISDKQLDMTSVLIDCEKIDMKTWKSMKNDYVTAIKNANIELKKIIAKNKLSPTVNLTCIKNGKITKIESTNPKCPNGYKELYKQ